MNILRQIYGVHANEPLCHLSIKTDLSQSNDFIKTLRECERQAMRNVIRPGEKTVITNEYPCVCV